MARKKSSHDLIEETYRAVSNEATTAAVSKLIDAGVYVSEEFVEALDNYIYSGLGTTAE